MGDNTTNADEQDNTSSIKEEANTSSITPEANTSSITQKDISNMFKNFMKSSQPPVPDRSRSSGAKIVKLTRFKRTGRLNSDFGRRSVNGTNVLVWEQQDTAGKRFKNVYVTEIAKPLPDYHPASGQTISDLKNAMKITDIRMVAPLAKEIFSEYKKNPRNFLVYQEYVGGSSKIKRRTKKRRTKKRRTTTRKK
jgi:hypothetical protein